MRASCPAGRDGGGQRVLRKLGKSGGQRICQRFAPLPERRADYLEEQLIPPQVDAHHGGIHLRRGHKVARRDREELFRRAVVTERRGDRAVIRAARSGAQPVGNLALHHDRDAVEGIAAFQKTHQNRRGDIIRKIGADRDALTRRLLPENLDKIDLENVRVDDLDVGKRAERVFQHRDERPVDLKGDDALVAFRQFRRQAADAGSDLHDHTVPVVAAGVGNSLGNCGIDEKVLPESLLRFRAERREDLADGAYIT